MVENAVLIMKILGVDEKFIGLTIVAFGTSLPELATSVVAAMRGEMDISIGNLVGSTKYVIWIFTILIILDTIGIKLNVLLAGSAALLVGVGLGLQNTFNDFISGIILLFEGSIKVGDILEIDNDVVKIQIIGLRTSEAMNRDDIVIILPNSLITTNKVINWSHQSKKTRFRINVGVAYGSDVDLVLEILQKSALEHPEIKDGLAINARSKISCSGGEMALKGGGSGGKWL